MIKSDKQFVPEETMHEDSILVVAHPDDEVLWFSSVLRMVKSVVVCFNDVRSNPVWSIGRQRSMSTHPLKNIVSLNVVESEVFNGTDWQHPETAPYGMKITRPGLDDTTYQQNYELLKRKLETTLEGYANVYTHNPWGEYGHEEHVQVYRAIRELQSKMQFRLWYSNYCSNKSLYLMMKYVNGFDSHYVTQPTDKALGRELRDHYKNNECWTWFDDYEWFNEECFMEDKNVEMTLRYGHNFPVNFIKVKAPWESEKNEEQHATWKRPLAALRKFIRCAKNLS